MTLLEARIHGRLVDTIFFPPRTIHPDLRAMLNPESLRKLKRKAPTGNQDDNQFVQATPKKARIAALEEPGFDDGGFGDGGFGDDSFGKEPQDRDPVNRASSVISELPNEYYIPETLEEEEEIPTSISGNMSSSTIAAATLLQRELSSSQGNSSSLTQLAKKANGPRTVVAREDAVKMFFEVLVLASRDLVRVKQERGGLFSRFGGGASVTV
jgi:hypothetical protein